MAASSKRYRITLQTILLIIVLSIRVWLANSGADLGRWQRPAELVLQFLIFLFTLRVVLLLVGWAYRKRRGMSATQNDNVIYGLSNIYYLLIVGFGFLTALGLLGINYIQLFTTLSIVAAAIAIIFKDFITEIVSGIIISFSRHITTDDYVKIGEYKGKIIDINLTKTSLLNDDDDIIYIPNNRVFTSELINYTMREIKKTSIEFEVNPDAIESVEHLESKLIESLADYKSFIEAGSYNLRIVHIKKDFLQMKFQYTLHQVNRELERTIRRKTARTVVQYTKKYKPAPPAAAAEADEAATETRTEMA